jgi:predicted phage terminase large subunit-like protein
MFRREWFRLIDAAPSAAPGERLPNSLRKVRFWDLASTEHNPGTDPDWTVGVLMGRAGGSYYVLDVRRTRGTPGTVEALVKQTAQMDGRDVAIVIEEEPASAGKALVASYVRALAGWNLRGHKPTGDKATRAAPLASQAEAGNVRLLRGPWNRAFLDELELFRGGGHDDQVDAAAGAFGHLAAHGTGTATPQCLGGGMQMPRV